MLRRPIITLTADDEPLDKNIMSRLMTLSITDNKGMDSDELSFTLDDADGALELPKRGVKLQCWLGYSDAGTHDMGIFTVDSSEWGGSPDTISVKAKSADFKSALKSGRNQSYHDKTLGDIAQEVATRQELELNITPELMGVVVGHIDQTDESDIHLMTRLCHRYGAVINIKQGKLLVFISSTNKSVSGLPLDLTVITRRSGDSYRYSVEDRQSDYDNVSASYQDKGKATRKTVNTNDGKTKTRRLKGTFKSKDEAMAAAHSEEKRLKEQQAKFSITTAYAYPGVSTESPITLQGFKPQIDSLAWTADKAIHSYIKSGGLTTQLDLLATLN